ncbi:hypothetical protein HK101_000202 [Irineochytrium annulatum]|nr:hypothetical protein HK101_000202 [Irineochytrium annulatum]
MSDIHTIDSGWGPTRYPCIVGHEIVGHVVAKGNTVDHLAVGDRVGVGAQCWACLDPKCDACRMGEDNLCPRSVGTYNSKYADGQQSQGGYADFVRVSSRFAFKLPESLSSSDAAPLLCAGVTVYAPLRRFGCGPGMKVGVAGIGGLGHLACQFASKMGAHVVGVSTTAAKEGDATKLGCAGFVALADKVGVKKVRGTLDLIIVTAVDGRTGSLDQLLSLLTNNGKMVVVGAPEVALKMQPFSLIMRQRGVYGSSIGSRRDVEEMLEFAAMYRVVPWVEKMKMKDCNEAVEKVRKGTPRFRVVLETGMKESL